MHYYSIIYITQSVVYTTLLHFLHFKFTANRLNFLIFVRI